MISIYLSHIRLPRQTMVFGKKEFFHYGYGELDSEACATIALVENLLATDETQRFLACVESRTLLHTLCHEVCTGATAEEVLNRRLKRWESYLQARRTQMPSRV